MHAVLAQLPLALLFLLVLQALASRSAFALIALALGFGVGVAAPVFDGRISAWIALAAGLCLSGAGLVAAGAFGVRKLPPIAAPILGFCTSFGATPLPDSLFAQAAMFALGALAYALRRNFSKHPADGILLLIAGALVANGTYAGLGFWLVEWFG